MENMKCKGKQIDNNEWIEGYYYYDIEYKRHMMWVHEFYGEGLCNSIHEVNPETVERI